jgi:hypothetical protein
MGKVDNVLGELCKCVDATIRSAFESASGREGLNY